MTDSTKKYVIDNVYLIEEDIFTFDLNAFSDIISLFCSKHYEFQILPDLKLVFFYIFYSPS